MLVTYKDSLEQVGLAVTQWRIEGKLRTFVVYPFIGTVQSYVEVDCATVEEKGLIIVAKQTSDWQPIDNGFGDESVGYKFSDKTAGCLYKVWDDGAKRQMDGAQKLFITFKGLIDFYVDPANRYLSTVSIEKYAQQIKSAKENGWDTSIIARESLTSPYTTT